MEFLDVFLEGNVWPAILSLVFGAISLIFGSKWVKLKKEVSEFGKATADLIELVTSLPDKPSSKDLEKIKEEALLVVKEFKDIIAVFKKDNGGS